MYILPLFAIAYVCEELPRHDRVEHVGNKLRYFDKGMMVYEEIIPNWIITRHPQLGLKFVTAENSTEAHRNFIESFPQHVTAITIAQFPPKTRSPPKTPSFSLNRI